MKVAMLAPMIVLAALTAAGHPGAPVVAQAPRSATDTTVVEIYSTVAGGLTFEPDEIRAKAGTPLKIRFVNESPLSHNVVILKNQKDLDEIGAASFHAGASHFVPPEHKAKLVGYSTVAEAGKTVTFAITVPPVGEYLFVCFVDGHFNMMIGKLKSFK